MAGLWDQPRLNLASSERPKADLRAGTWLIKKFVFASKTYSRNSYVSLQIQSYYEEYTRQPTVRSEGYFGI